MTEVEQAKAAMSALDSVNARLAERTRRPFWRHAVVGAMVAAVVAARELSGGVRLGTYVMIFIALTVIVRHDRRTNGMFVNGWRRGPTKWVTILMLAGSVAALVAMEELKPLTNGNIGLFTLIVAGTMVWVTGLSYLWQTIYQRELGVK